MLEPKLYHIFVGDFNKLGIRYMVTGAAASIIYGEPRLTDDIEIEKLMLEKEWSAAKNYWL